MIRAEFERVKGIDPVRVAVETAVGVPVPVPRRREFLAIEVDDDVVRVGGDAFPRGAVGARIRALDERTVELELRTDRRLHLRAAATDAAVEVAERLARDTRVAQGTDAEADAALRALAEATLPPELRTDRHTALRAVAALLAPGERPVALGGAMRGLSDGIVVLTDRCLGWWAGGRRAAVVIPRDAITAARAEDDELRIEHGGEETVLAFVEPPERAAQLVALLDLPAPAGVDALADGDEAVAGRVRRELPLVRELWEDGERGELLAIGFVGAKHGALVLTDRRLLWASRKADPLVLARAEIAGATAKRSFGATRLDVALRDGAALRFDVVEPKERAEALAAAIR